jgi:cytochrome c-type biogenesis protein CcmE
MRKRSQRLWLIGAAAVLVTGAVALAATALQDTVAFFQSPSDVAQKGATSFTQSVRIGGLVEKGSETHGASGELLFKITDGKNTVPVMFEGIPPDLFQEGKGVVAEGKFDESGRLVAKRVLAKHDENYMPKETYDALKRAAESNGETSYPKEPNT